MARRNRFNRDAISETSHELKAPLSAIRGAAELLRDSAGEDPAARRRFLDNILHEVERLTRLIRDLRRWTEITPQAVRRQRRSLDYAAWVREVGERLRLAYGERGAELRIEVPVGPLPLTVAPDLIEQVITNLVDNAFRHTPPGGTVALRVWREDDAVATAVEDTGAGIDAANLDRVFDPYFTTVPKGGQRDEGRGMGLTIARSIVEAHRGRIRVQSPVAERTDAAPPASGPGARFVFTLPLPGRHR